MCKKIILEFVWFVPTFLTFIYISYGKIDWFDFILVPLIIFPGYLMIKQIIVKTEEKKEIRNLLKEIDEKNHSV